MGKMHRALDSAISRLEKAITKVRDDDWRTIKGAHVLVGEGGEIKGGAGGKFNGQKFGRKQNHTSSSSKEVSGEKLAGEKDRQFFRKLIDPDSHELFDKNLITRQLKPDQVEAFYNGQLSVIDVGGDNIAVLSNYGSKKYPGGILVQVPKSTLKVPESRYERAKEVFAAEKELKEMARKADSGK